MPYVVAAVVFVGALCLLNLVLTFGVIRRLREHTDLLSRALRSQPSADPIILGAGATVGEFAATTLDGVPVTRADLRGETLVGFLSPHCPACTEQLPGFLARAGATAGGRERVLAVIVSSGDDTEALAAQLAPVARVVRESDPGPVMTAFGVTGFPAFALMADDVVAASDYALDRLPDTVPA